METTETRIVPAQAVRATDERVLLEGPHSRTRELWLVLRTVRDFVAGFRTLHFVGPCVTVHDIRSPARVVDNPLGFDAHMMPLRAPLLLV